MKIEIIIDGQVADDIRELAKLKDISSEKAAVDVLNLYAGRRLENVKAAYRAADRAIKKDY